MRRTDSVRQIAQIGILAALIAVMSQISIPLPGGVPLTMQVFAVALSGMMLGPAMGALAVGVYLALGAAGMPVFSNLQGGLQVLAGPTGGFLYGFVLMAALCGVGAGLGRRGMILCGLAAFAACHLCGIVQFSLVMGRGLIETVLLTTVPFIAKDLASILVAAVVARRLRAFRLGAGQA